MKNRTVTVAAVVLHIIFGGILYAATTTQNDPTDDILVRANYSRQSAFLLISSANAEIIIDGSRYELSCSPYKNALNQVEAIEGPTGNFILYDAGSGTATARIGGKYYTFLSE